MGIRNAPSLKTNKEINFSLINLNGHLLSLVRIEVWPLSYTIHGMVLHNSWLFNSVRTYSSASTLNNITFINFRIQFKFHKKFFLLNQAVHQKQKNRFYGIIFVCSQHYFSCHSCCIVSMLFYLPVQSVLQCSFAFCVNNPKHRIADYIRGNGLLIQCKPYC